MFKIINEIPIFFKMINEHVINKILYLLFGALTNKSTFMFTQVCEI